MLATKLRAFLQRDKGRDLYDLSHALQVFKTLDADRTINLFARCLAPSAQMISKARAQQRMFPKLANPSLLTDMRPLLPAERAEKVTEETAWHAFRSVFETLINRPPGEDWAKTADRKRRFALP